MASAASWGRRLRKGGGELRMPLGQRIAHLLSQPPVVLVDALRLDTGPVLPRSGLVL
jgi:hypothetical protein